MRGEVTNKQIAILSRPLAAREDAVAQRRSENVCRCRQTHQTALARLHRSLPGGHGRGKFFLLEHRGNPRTRTAGLFHHEVGTRRETGRGEDFFQS